MPNPRYTKNFLTQVIFRIDISAILSLSKELLVAFQEKIRNEYPVFDVIDAVNITTTFDASTKTQKNENFSYKQFAFFTDDKSVKVTIAYNFLTIESTNYTNFKAFCERIEKVISIFNDVYSPVIIERLGLRYINELKFPEGTPFENFKYINKYLVQKEVSFFGGDRNIVRSMSQTIINKDEYSIAITNGYFNGEYPNKITRNEYIIDIDCYTVEAKIETICSQLSSFNNDMVAIFERSITDETRKLMGVSYE